MSPSMAREIVELNARVVLSGVLPAIRVPTLVLHQKDNPLVPLQARREVGALIPGGRFVAGGGTDVHNWPGPDNPGRGGGVPHRAPVPPRSGAGAGDGLVHRHRRIDRPRGAAR